MTSGDVHRLYVTLGSFPSSVWSVTLSCSCRCTITAMPEKECTCGGDDCREDPCELFRKVQFPGQ